MALHWRLDCLAWGIAVLRTLIFMLALMLVGCASEPVRTADEALIIFLRPGMVRSTGSASLGSGSYQPTYGPAFTVTLHDITKAEPNLVAILSVGEKFGYPVKAGAHRFMLMARNQSDFLEAKVDAGKTYYVIVEQAPVRGWDRHSLRPVRRDDFGGREFKDLDTSANFVAGSRDWKKWEERNAAAVKRTTERPARLSPKVLGPEDGR